MDRSSRVEGDTLDCCRRSPWRDRNKSGRVTRPFRKKISLLFEASTSLRSTQGMDEMPSTILHKITSIFDIQGSSVALPAPANEELYFITVVDIGPYLKKTTTTLQGMLNKTADYQPQVE